MSALTVALEFALIVFLGIFIMRIRLVSTAFRKELAVFVTKVALPCMIARSIYSRTEALDGLGGLLLLSVCTITLLLLAGQALFLLMKRSELGSSARFSLAFGNFTFMGFPVVESLYGADGLFAFTMFTLPIRIAFYTSPGFLLCPQGGQRQRFTWKLLLKNLITPPILAVAAGLLLHAFQLTPPLFLDKAVQALGSCSSVLGMLLVGMGMSELTLRGLWERRRAFSIVLAKAVLCPLLMLALFSLFPLDSTLKQPLFLYGAVPVPSLLTAFSLTQGRSEEACQDASAAVLLSTLLSVATLPLWANLGAKLL